MATLLSRSTEELLAATLATNVMLMHANVDYIRVHDVKAHHDALNMIRVINKD